MSTGDEVLPGNMGLWDLIAALKWIQRNAAVFEGDPGRVTLMGHGSGASAASILALSPRAQGLFHSAILLSGTAWSPGALRDTAVNATWNLQTTLNCRAFNSTELLDCLKNRHRTLLTTDERPVPPPLFLLPILRGKAELDLACSGCTTTTTRSGCRSRTATAASSPTTPTASSSTSPRSPSSSAPPATRAPYGSVPPPLIPFCLTPHTPPTPPVFFGRHGVNVSELSSKEAVNLVHNLTDE